MAYKIIPATEPLIVQLTYVQARIREIMANAKLDIKQISDLQRYISMQNDIVNSIARIEAL